MMVLGVVFTEGVSLQVWVEQGIIDREKQIYEEHLKQKHFDKVVWFTYGIHDDRIRNMLVQSGKLDKRIEVVSMPGTFFHRYMIPVYSYLLPIIWRKECKTLCLIKTNQMGGAWAAEIIHRKYGIPFLLRTGYTYSHFYLEKMKKEASVYKKSKLCRKYKWYKNVESNLYQQCTFATVSSKHDKKYICAQYHISKSKIGVLTNYVDCNLFQKMKNRMSESNRFVFVGRLSEQKNLYHTIQALGELGIGLDIYGEGEQKEQLIQFVKNNQYDVCFKGIVDNKDLPMIYNCYKYYILASFYEGMPKTLLEAMACGCVCFGTRVEGIKEVIRDGENGYLIEDTSVKGIKKAVSEGIQQRSNDCISDNAVSYINKHHSLESVVREEWKIMKRMIGEQVING